MSLLLPEIYRDYEHLLSNENLIHCLNAILKTLDYDSKKCDMSLYKKDVSSDYATDRVSEKTLNELMKNGKNVATDDANVIKFNNFQFDNTLRLVASMFKGQDAAIGISGRTWYPSNGYMGWHTNLDSQGYRLYCAHSREENKSFFRYRDPQSGKIITSTDKQGWNFRMFNITKETPVWHCVYSETDRVSIGFNLIPNSLRPTL